MTRSLAEYDAPHGQTWVCAACGKTASNRAGAGEGTKSRGWDESCFIHAVLCYVEKGPNGAWIAVTESKEA